MADGLAPKGEAALHAEVWDALRAYLASHKDVLRLDLSEISDAPRIASYRDGALVFVYAPRVVDGIPVRDNSIGAAVNGGNLILLGVQKWGDVDVSRTPAIEAPAAEAVVRSHAAPLQVRGAREGLSPRARASVRSGGHPLPPGLGRDVPDRGRPGHLGRPRGRGQRRADRLRGQEPVRGPQGRSAASTRSATTSARPDGIEQAGWPMPFVNVTRRRRHASRPTPAAPSAASPGTISTALTGRYVAHRRHLRRRQRDRGRGRPRPRLRARRPLPPTARSPPATPPATPSPRRTGLLRAEPHQRAGPRLPARQHRGCSAPAHRQHEHQP